MVPTPTPAPWGEASFSSEDGKGAVAGFRRRRNMKLEDFNDNSFKDNGDLKGKMGESSSWKRKFFRVGQMKVFVQFIIACFVLYAWVSIFRFKVSLQNYPEINFSSSIQDPNSTGNIANSGRSAYDSIFCRAKRGSPQQNPEKDNSADKRKSSVKPVFLWGIPSTTSEFEIGRRELLRKTYLDFFRQIQGDDRYKKSIANTKNTTVSDDMTKNPICSLHEWTCDERVRADCRMIYVFFVGGHQSIDANITNEKQEGQPGPSVPPPVLLDESITDFREMLLPPESKNAKGLNLTELGTVYLDIRENQFDGKMTTWFKFASLVAKEFNSAPKTGFLEKIDYIFKVDSDLMLLTPHFFHWLNGVHIEQQRKQGLLPNTAIRSHHQPTPVPFVKRVYGGIEFPATNCDMNYTFDHDCPLPLSGPSYMSGELNFMSVDLATYIASDSCPRDQWTIPHEDVSLSNYVYSYTNNTAYHERTKVQTDSIDSNEEHSIHVVSVNTSNVLLTPGTRADWHKVNLRKNPDLLRNGELLWGHTTKRGNHTRYLYWKKDTKFSRFWKLFYKVYTTTGNLTTTAKTSRQKKKQPQVDKSKTKDKPLSFIQQALQRKHAKQKKGDVKETSHQKKKQPQVDESKTKDKPLSLIQQALQRKHAKQKKGDVKETNRQKKIQPQVDERKTKDKPLSIIPQAIQRKHAKQMKGRNKNQGR